MIKMDIANFNRNYKKRDAFYKINDFIHSDKCLDGNILIIYGLRRTGKTVLMQQVLKEYENIDECAFYEVEDEDTLKDIKSILIEEYDKGTRIILFDEITKARDFITKSAALPDIFAKDGMKIVVTGTDSLGFVFANNYELYGRTIIVNTSHIPFSEHCRVLGTNDIDDYIQYGGIMQKGADEKKYIYDFKSSLKYLDSAVSENISRSIVKNYEDNDLRNLSLLELKTIIEKLVEKYSGQFDISVIKNKLNAVSVNYPVKKIDKIDSNIIKKLSLLDDDITEAFANEINANYKIRCNITQEMVRTLKNYLIDMNVLSVVKEKEYSYTEELGWRTKAILQKAYIVQPAIKYYHLKEGKRFIEEQPFYNDLSFDTKKTMKEKLEEYINGLMVEEIIVFDMGKILNPDQYEVFKTAFYNGAFKKGEYDMLVYDKKNNMYWSFEIKHTSEPYYKQEKHLVDRNFKEIMNYQYGERRESCVLYRGKSFISSTGIIYLNITDFMLEVEKHRDMEKAIKELLADLETKDIYPKENTEQDYGDQLISELKHENKPAARSSARGSRDTANGMKPV